MQAPGHRPPRCARCRSVGETDDAERGAVALLGVGPGREDLGDERGGLRPGLLRPGDDAAGRPLGVAPVGLGHVRRIGRVAAAHDFAAWRGDALWRKNTSTVEADTRTSTALPTSW